MLREIIIIIIIIIITIIIIIIINNNNNNNKQCLLEGLTGKYLVFTLPSGLCSE